MTPVVNLSLADALMCLAPAWSCVIGRFWLVVASIWLLTVDVHMCNALLSCSPDPQTQAGGQHDMASSQAMADLFALQRIHADVLFRNDDYVAAEKAKAIGRLLEQLRREVREQAVPLVDAWNLPVRLLGVVLGLARHLGSGLFCLWMLGTSWYKSLGHNSARVPLSASMSLLGLF